MNRIRTTIRTGCFYLLIVLFCPSTATAADEGDTILLTAEDIRAMQALKIADVLNNVPGVKAGDSSVTIQGSYKVKVFLDSRPINDPTSSYGAVNWELVSPDDVERIEILRGKGGLRYGQDAAGGVILIYTKRIQRLTGNVKTYGGSHDTGHGQAGLQMTAGNLGIGVNGGFETTEGYTVNDDKERRQAGLKLAYSQNERKSLSFSADYLEDQRGLSGLPEYPTPFSRKSTRTTGLSLQFLYDRLTGTTFFNDGRNHNTDISRRLDQTLSVSELGQDLAASMMTGNWGELNFGGGYRQGRAEGSTFDDQTEETFSVFAAQSLQWPNTPFTLSFGLRANINSAFDDALNPEIKAFYKKSYWRLTAAYNRTNNTPSFNQRYNETASTRPNPELEMETSDNYSLALFVQPRTTLSGSVSIFHNRLSNRITYVTGDDGIGRYQNFGEVTYTGGDLAVAWQPHELITIKGSYTYLEAMDEETGLYLPAKAKHQANLDIYLQPFDRFSMVAGGQYTSSVYGNQSNTKTIPEYVIGNIRAEYAFQRFSLFGEVKNVFDKTYYYADGYLAPPCTWVIGVNWRI